MNTEKKNLIIEEIQTAILDLQCDLKNELTDVKEAQEINHDLSSLKTVLGHLLTLQTI